MDDVYAIEKGKSFTLQVFDNRNGLLRQDEVRLGPFGTFFAAFALPATCSLGVWGARPRRGRARHQGRCSSTNEYRLEPVQLVVDAPRACYCRA